MQFNIATLLQEAVGSSRVFSVDGEPVTVAEADYSTHASGTIDVMRILDGVLVRARLAVEARVECSRCLSDTTIEVPVTFSEEFAAGTPGSNAEIDPEPDQFTIDDQHLLDLNEAIRQYVQTALPLQPVCRDDCRGLCPDCGVNRNEQPCTCADQQTDHRWGALGDLAEQMRADEIDGTPQA